MRHARVAKTVLKLLEAGYKNEAQQLLLSSIRAASQGTQMLKGLLSYLSMSELDRHIELIYGSEFFVREYSSVIQQTLADPKVSPKAKQELSSLSDDTYLTELSQQTIETVAKHITEKELQQILSAIERYEPGETPLWAAASLNSNRIQKGWLLHRTNNADQIESNGFLYGIEDMRLLALTTHIGDAYKKQGGYNFAFTPKDFKHYGRRGHYGDELILFYAPYVYMHHYADDEPQAVFWGKDAEHIQQVYEDDGYYTILVEDKDGEEDEVEVSDIADLIDVVRKSTGKR